MADTAGREGESLYFFSDCYNFLYKYKERQGEIYYVFIFAFGITFFFFFGCLWRGEGLRAVQHAAQVQLDRLGGGAEAQTLPCPVPPHSQTADPTLKLLSSHER